MSATERSLLSEIAQANCNVMAAADAAMRAAVVRLSQHQGQFARILRWVDMYNRGLTSADGAMMNIERIAKEDPL